MSREAAGSTHAAGAPAEAVGAAAERPSLGTSRINPPADAAGEALRASRWVRYMRRQQSSTWLIGAAREAIGLPYFFDALDSSEWVRPLRPARCRWRIDEAVGVHWSEGRPAHWSGLERCGSIWACPVCSAVIRHGRSTEIQTAADRWTETGGGVSMLTLTTRHRKSDPLAQNLDLALKGWEELTKRKPWKAIRERLGLAGYIRAVEVTWSWANGWHPHIHALLLTERPLSDQEALDLQREVFGLWEGVVVRLGGRKLDRRHGVRVSAATSAEYVAKVQEHDRAGLEMARLDLKSGRAGSLMPFELLDQAEHVGRWVEYVDATWRRRAITWSRGLKVLLSIGERTDEEVLADTETSDLIGLMTAAEYDSIRNDPTALTAVLEEAEGHR